ncbi:hypothetical protein EYD45_08570 [Hyunsoonleella flava]|uniref:Gliding motility-associated protein GldM N-terminal domain-containing protein n=1 Tax=Hyunsoonleella flava TaxID=2527939 RepID=A0A4V2JA93_9FLAO|nr:hypothetical protein [Hyunsoonleella flava]TBN04053.1 hypothetical protein EYD45_08570 [Hyunsoonleella flava]
MKLIKFLLLLTIVYSCKTDSKTDLKPDSDVNETYTMYGFLIEEFVHSSTMLKDQIAENLSNDKLLNDDTTQTYHSLTTEYLKYLDSVYWKLFDKINDQYDYNGELSNKELINEFFFNGEKYNEKATKFISKLESYRTEILKLITDKNLAERVRRELNTDSVQNREAKKFDYLNYMYKDLPLISVLSHMKYREKVIIEFENDFLKNRMLNE